MLLMVGLANAEDDKNHITTKPQNLLRPQDPKMLERKFTVMSATLRAHAHLCLSLTAQTSGGCYLQ